MNIKRFIKICGFLLFSVLLLSSFCKVDESSGNNGNTIDWKQNQPLKWSDFQAKPDATTHLHAYTMVGIKTDFISSDGQQAELAVIGYFDKSKSWVKKDQKTAELLVHEQRHFDLCEIYRRKLKKELADYQGFTYSNFSNEANRLFTEVFQAFTKEQHRYDAETKHSKLKDKQQAWGVKIDAELRKFDEYAGQRVTVKMTK